MDFDADVRIRLAVGSLPEVDHSAPAAELGLGVDLDVALDRADEIGIDHVRDGERVVDRRAVEVVDGPVEGVVEAQQFRHHLPHSPGEPTDVRLSEERLVRDVEADHRHVDVACEDARGGLGIAPDVELGGRSHVSLGDRTSHQHDSFGTRIGMQRKQEGNVGQRSDRDQRHGPLRPANLVGEEVDGVLSNRFFLRRRQIRSVETRLAVDVRRNELLAHERTVRTRCDGNVATSRELEHADGIRSRLVERLVAGDRRDAEDLHLGRGERQEQCDRVVVTGVAVDEDRRRAHGPTCGL